MRSPRTVAFFTAGPLLVAVVGVGARLPVPYVVISPGLAQNTLGETGDKPLIEVADHPTYPTTGQLDFTAIRVTRPEARLSLGFAMRAWLDPDLAIVPRRLYYRDDETDAQQREVNAELMSQSQEDAKAAALRQAGEQVPAAVVVTAVRKDSPADGVLKASDVIRTVDGASVPTADEVRAAVSARAVGQTVRLGVERDGQPLDFTLATVAAGEGSARATIGVVPGVGYDFPFPVTINVSDRIGGPSAGLMLSLGIYDKITDGALTGGRHVAGTGTVDAAGEVGAIGGIRQKIVAARGAGASVFLAPAANCDEVVLADPGDMRVVRVEKLSEAVADLGRAAQGDLADLPRCQAG